MALILTNADIIQTLEMLADQILKAEDGTTSTIKSEQLISISDIEGYIVVFLNGELNGINSSILSVDGEAETVTLDDVLPYQVTRTTKFAILETGYLSFVTRAEAIITSAFRNKGIDINLFLNDAQLKELHIYKTIELICLSKRRDATDEDVYHSNYESFKSLYNLEFANLAADYDANENGVIDEDEELTQIGQVSFFK